MATSVRLRERSPMSFFHAQRRRSSAVSLSRAALFLRVAESIVERYVAGARSDHGNRTDAHRDSGQHRTERPSEKRIQRASRNRQPCEVVGECPEQVLFDVPKRDATQMHCSLAFAII